MTDFNTLFDSRTGSILLQLDELTPTRKSKVGGLPPAFSNEEMDKNHLDTGHQYLFTLSDEFSDFIGGKDLSVFIPKNYADYSSKSIYPDFNLKCFIHEHTTNLSSNKSLIYTSIKESSLVNVVRTSDNDEEHTYFIKVGATPYLLQEERYFYADLEEQGYNFIFQLDENGLDGGFLSGDYPFGFGAVYFYGKIDSATKTIHNIIAGFWQR